MLSGTLRQGVRGVTRGSAFLIRCCFVVYDTKRACYGQYKGRARAFGESADLGGGERKRALCNEHYILLISAYDFSALSATLKV